MSEDDNDMLGPDGQPPTRIDRDRRAPRFSWTPAYEATFFRSLCESVSLGLRENSSFKAEAWERAAQALQESHGAYPTKSHLINKSDNARKRFRLWRGLREDPEFLYNPVAKTVTATEDAWRMHIEREPLSRALRGRPFDHEEYMEILYPDVVGSGGAPKRIMKPRRRTDGPMTDDSEMPGTGVLNLQQSEPPPRTFGPESPSQQRPSLSQTPSGSSTNSVPQQVQPQQQLPTPSQTQSLPPPNSHSQSQPPQLPPQPPQKPMSTTIPPRAPVAIANAMALTPPDETVTTQGRKRQLPVPPNITGTFDATPSTTTLCLGQPQPSSPEKRRRTSSDLPRPPITSATINSSVLQTTLPDVPEPAASPMQIDTRTLGNSALLEELVDIFKTRSAPRWREDALDTFFRDFADEELDFQVKISEMLSHEDKAMLFCKMPLRVRQHWIHRLRELHHRAP